MTARVVPHRTVWSWEALAIRRLSTRRRHTLQSPHGHAEAPLVPGRSPTPRRARFGHFELLAIQLPSGENVPTNRIAECDVPNVPKYAQHSEILSTRGLPDSHGLSFALVAIRLPSGENTTAHFRLVVPQLHRFD